MFQDLFHKILFHFNTDGPFYRTKNLFKYLTTYVTLRPTIIKYLPEYEKSFDKLFFTAIPTVETYDFEELKLIKEMYEKK